jgi:xanthine dehydrogenase accessory factor
MNRAAVRESRSLHTGSAAVSEWLKPLRAWPGELLRALDREPAVVRVVVASVRGSAPREAGACMLVGINRSAGTIGGGHLEWQALSAARELLNDGAPSATVRRVILGTDLAQCCGGVVEVWIERYSQTDRATVSAIDRAARGGHAFLLSTMSNTGVDRQVISSKLASVSAHSALRLLPAGTRANLSVNAEGRGTLLERIDVALPPVWMYGAGHVGQALARIFTDLPVQLTWIDSRAEFLPADNADSIRVMHAADPERTVETAPPDARFLVLTHSHPLDYAICRAILRRGSFAWLGLIGSSSKSARFRSRLAREGLPSEVIGRLVCPIGDRSISSKWPGAIAVGVAAQLLRDISVSAADDAGSRPHPVSELPCPNGDCANCQQPARGAE